MPAQRPRAAFEPIPPDFDIKALVEETPNFEYAVRVPFESIAEHGIDQFEKLVTLHVIVGGKPLVVDGLNEVLDPWTFTTQWLNVNHGEKVENARVLSTGNNLPLTIGHYLKNMRPLTDQYFDVKDAYRDKNRQRVYLKDIDCPPVWRDKLQERLPPGVFYLNESIGQLGGPGSVDEPIPKATGLRKGRGMAKAGDLMSSLPSDMRADNLMCYIGHEGTYTPAHREMCASLGQNIMVECSGTMGQDGKSEKPGSSIWLMTETKDRHAVSEYWLSVLGHDIEVENHFAQLVAWRKAPFKTWVVEQKVGDFILIPPLAPHQVWNRGTRTMKVAWNRTTVETLEMAMNEALPNARMVCRDEQYKNKAIVYYTLLKYSAMLKILKVQIAAATTDEARHALGRGKIRQVKKDFVRLFSLFRTIILSEMFAPNSVVKPQFIQYDSNVTCAYCRGNIFNRFLTCSTCTDGLGPGTDEPYDVCMECYVMGRSCWCVSGLKWVEQWKWRDLVHNYEEWRNQIIDIEGDRTTAKTPMNLPEERAQHRTKTLAEMCQNQLKLRPWVDYKNPTKELEDEEEEIQVDDEGKVKSVRKKHGKNTHKCHSCIHRHPRWKMAGCTMCNRWWCFGILFRAYDLNPRTVIEDEKWECPHCLKICAVAGCRSDERQHPYEPKGTLLGHDTKRVADARSVESLVDFGKSNLNWLREMADVPGQSKRLQQRQAEADMAKMQDPVLDDDYASDDHAPAANPAGDDAGSDRIEYAYEMDTTLDPQFGDNSVHHGIYGDPSQSAYTSGPYAVGGSYFNPDDPNSQHEPSAESGFVAPSALVYHPSPVYHDRQDDAYVYPEVNGVDSVVPVASPSLKRRAPLNLDEHIKLDDPYKRRRKADDAPAKNVAGKQYQREQEKKQLEAAKKEGRYVIAFAALRNKSRIAKLSMSKDRLGEVVKTSKKRKTQGSRPETGPEVSPSVPSPQKVLVRSDILPAAVARAGNSAAQLKQPSKIRYRVEQDDDFRTTKPRISRAKEANSATKSQKAKANYNYEEISDDSDDGWLSPDAGEPTDTVPPPRRSFARTQAGDANAPTELPEDWKDAKIGRNRKLKSNGAASPSRKVQAAAMTPSQLARKVLASGKDLASSNGETKRPAVDETPVSQEAQLIEDNLKAKRAAASLADSNSSISNPDSDSVSSSATPPAVADPGSGDRWSPGPLPLMPAMIPSRGIGRPRGRPKRHTNLSRISYSKRNEPSTQGEKDAKLQVEDSAATSGFTPVNQPASASKAPPTRGRGRPSRGTHSFRPSGATNSGPPDSSDNSDSFDSDSDVSIPAFKQNFAAVSTYDGAKGRGSARGGRGAAAGGRGRRRGRPRGSARAY